MCTVSGIGPVASGRGARLRVVVNRDEQRARTRSLPPEVRRIGGDRSGLWPVDPQGGGTWVGVNDAGVVLALLNGNPRGRGLPGSVSRGTLIPSLLAEESVEAVVDAVREVRTGVLGPFRLVACSAEAWAEVVWDERELAVSEPVSLPVTWMRTSSSLGDDLVGHPRSRLFAEMVSRQDPTAEQQDRFHSHVWPDRPELSVRMSRRDARTVSVTVVEVWGDRAEMRHVENGGAPGEFDASVSWADTPSPVALSMRERSGRGETSRGMK